MAGNVTISSSTTLTPATAAFYAGDDVTVDGSGVVLTLEPHDSYGTLVAYSFHSLTVANGASVACDGQTNGPAYDADAKGVAIVAAGAVTVNAGCGISATGRGFAPGKGPGVGIPQITGYCRSGSSHGGAGGRTAIWWHDGGGPYYTPGPGSFLTNALPEENYAPLADTYGSLTAPTSLGSGGCGGPSAGGGAVKISATTVTVDGTVEANATDNTVENFASPGSGGSIWIVAGTLNGAGTGKITAHGGNDYVPHYRTGGGGGGRIAVNVGINSFGGLIGAYGGYPRSNDYPNVAFGGAGTVFIKTSAQTYGELVVDNSNNAPCGMTHLAGTNDTATYTFDKLTIRRPARLEIVPGQTVDMSDPTRPIVAAGTAAVLPGYGTASLINNGTLALPVTYSLTNLSLALHNGSSLGNLQDLTVGPPSGELTHQPNWAVLTYPFSVWAGRTDAWHRLEYTFRNLTILPGGKVSADEAGWGQQRGPGMGVVVGNDTYIGANHAGLGEKNVSNLTTYGNATMPTNHGSGGCWWQAPTHGGGVIRLTAQDTLTVDGDISAKGSDPLYGGAGSGGSIWLSAGRLAGTGTIRADGGFRNGSSGGGGRVAIKYGRSSFTGLPAPGLYTNQQSMSATVSAKGGYNTSADGPEDGSVFVEKVPFTSVFVVR